MTVPVQTPFTSSVANGVTTVFPYNFMIADDDDMKVVVDDVVQTSGYTVTGIGNPAGGDVIFSVAPANGLKVLRYLDPLLKRETDYQQFGDFLADTVNLDFDKIWLALQAINQNFKRSLKLPVDTTTDQAITEDAAARTGKVVSFDSSGNMVLLLPADLSAATFISTYMETLLAAIDAADARTILDLVIGTDVQAFMASASQAEMEAGTEAALRAMSPLRVKQAIAAITPNNGLRNRIINGGFQINQRRLTSVADDDYCLDRWYALTETGNVTVAQQTDQENGTPFNIRLTQPDVSAKQIGLAQIIEAANCKDLRGKSAALKLRVRNSDGGQINYAIIEWSGTADAVTSDIISAWAGAPTYIGSVTERAKGTVTPAANTWTDVTAITGTINAASNNLIVFVWSNADMAQNATIDLARVQLEEGATASSFEARAVSVELAFCQRYFEKSWNLASNIGATTGDGAETIRQSVTSEDKTMFNAGFRVRKRAIPTVTWYNPNTGASGQIYDIGATASRTVTGTYVNTPTSEVKLGAPTHSSVGTAGNIIWAHWTASAEL